MAGSLFSRHEANKRRWEKIKKDPLLYDKYRKIQKKSYIKNKERINEYSNEYRKQMRQIWKERGLCTKCGDNRDNIKYKMCFKCRKYFRDRYKKLMSSQSVHKSQSEDEDE